MQPVYKDGVVQHVQKPPVSVTVSSNKQLVSDISILSNILIDIIYSKTVTIPWSILSADRRMNSLDALIVS